MGRRNPSAGEKWARFLAEALRIGGGTWGNILEAQKAEKEKQVVTDFMQETTENPLGVQTVAGVPMLHPRSGKPLGAAVESGMYEKYQRPADVQLANRYKTITGAVPPWLSERLKSLPLPKLTKMKTPAEKESAALTLQNLRQDVAWEAGRPTRRVEDKATKLIVKAEKAAADKMKAEEKAQTKLEKDQVTWDKKVAEYINYGENLKHFPAHLKMQEAMAKGEFFGVKRLILAKWKAENKNEYKKYYSEAVRLNNIYGPRPETTLVPEPTKPKVNSSSRAILKAKGYTDEEIEAATQ